MIKLIYSNLRQRPTRTVVSVLAVSLGVVLILVSVGLSYGQLNDTAERTRRIGGDFMFQPSNASFFFALDSGTLPVRIGELIEAVDGIEAATPILAKFISDRFHVIFGIDPESFQRVNTTLHFVQGRLFEAPYEAVVDTIYANTHGLTMGDKLELLGHAFTVSGIFHQGTASRVLVPLSTLQELNGTPDKATMFFMRASSGSSLDEVDRRLKERFEGYKITRTSELHQLMIDNTPAFRQFVVAVVLIACVISFLIILLSMYSTITERTREIGILKSLGASRSYIIQLILRESLLICGIGVALGFLLTWIAVEIIILNFPTLPVMITPQWRMIAAAMAIGGGSFGALYPALKAAQLDPVKALGYE